MIYKKDTAAVTEKHGVTMHIYTSADDCPQAAVAYQETATGHAEEFYHEKSAFIYYIIEGRGTWVIEVSSTRSRRVTLSLFPRAIGSILRAR